MRRPCKVARSAVWSTAHPYKAASVVLTILVLVLLLGELGLRVVVFPEAVQQAMYARNTANPGLYELDDLAGYVMIPNYHGRLHSADFDQTFDTNARGLRGPLPSDKPPGEFRIVLIGDSFVMGAEVPVEQRFSDRLEMLLRDRGHPNVRVVNVGVRGWGTYNEAGFLRENIAWLQPDLVVLSVFVGNIGENVLATAAGYQLKGDKIAYGPAAEALQGDSVTWFDHNFRFGAAEYLQPTLPRNDWSPTDELPVPRGNTRASGASASVASAAGYVPSSAVDATRTWLHQHSLLYRGLSETWFRIRHGYDRPDPLMVDNWLAYALREGPHTYWYDVALSMTSHYLDLARTAAAEANAPLVAVVIPRDSQVDEAKLQTQLQQYHLMADEIDIDRPQRELTVAAEQMAIPILDLQPTMQARSNRSQLFFAHDFHFTALGHAVAADALADWLQPLVQ